jgi:hypothetical protein
MSGLRFARGSAKGGELMQDCCLTCKNLEYRKNYVYPYRCLKHKAERFSEKELERMYFIQSEIVLDIIKANAAEIKAMMEGVDDGTD